MRFRRPTAITKSLIRKRSTRIPSGCWIWNGAANSSGYGKVYYSKRGKIVQEYAHRASWIAFHGPIPKYLMRKGKRWRAYVLHKRACNTKKCCNPRHLYIGTNSDNSFDMHASPVGVKVRAAVGAGSRRKWNSMSTKQRSAFAKRSGWNSLSHEERCRIARLSWRNRV